MIKTNWYEPYRKYKDIEEKLPTMRKKLFEKCIKKYPKIKYKNFAGLTQGVKHNKLEEDVLSYIKDDYSEIVLLKEKMKELKDESESLLEKQKVSDTRKQLDPLTDVIPENEYPKLKNCSIYPLRKSCNHGDNKSSKWDRCEYMKYDNAKSIFDKDRWECIYKCN